MKVEHDYHNVYIHNVSNIYTIFETDVSEIYEIESNVFLLVSAGNTL